MYRLSDELAKLILSKIKAPEIESSGPDAFLPKSLNSVGIIDPTCAIGTQYHYLLETPVPIIFPDLSHIPPSVNGYFLYRKEELLQPMESWLIIEALINPLAKDYENQIDVSDCAVVLPSDTEKLTAKRISTIERLIELEPRISNCLNLEK